MSIEKTSKLGDSVYPRDLSDSAEVTTSKSGSIKSPTDLREKITNTLDLSEKLQAFYERTYLNPKVSLKKTTSSESLDSVSTVVSSYSVPDTELSAETVSLYDDNTPTQSSEKPRFPFFVLIHGLFLQQKENGNYKDYRLKRDQYEESAEKIMIAENEGKSIPDSLQSDHKENKQNFDSFVKSEDLKQIIDFEKLLEEGGENELRFILSLFDEFSTKYPEINESRLIFLVEREYVIDALEKQKILPTPESNAFLVEQAKLKQKFLGANTFVLPDTRSKKSASKSFDWSSLPFLYVAAFFTAIANLFSLFADQKNDKNKSFNIRPR